MAELKEQYWPYNNEKEMISDFIERFGKISKICRSRNRCINYRQTHLNFSIKFSFIY